MLKGVQTLFDGEQETILIDSVFRIDNSKITESYGKDIKRFLDGLTQDFQCFDFDSEKKIYHRGGNSLIIEYTNKELRDKDKELHKTYFKSNRKYFSQELEGGLQIGEFDGEIDYKGKYYIILDGLNKLIDKTDDIAFRGIVINIQDYLKIKGILGAQENTKKGFEEVYKDGPN